MLGLPQRAPGLRRRENGHQLRNESTLCSIQKTASGRPRVEVEHSYRQHLHHLSADELRQRQREGKKTQANPREMESSPLLYKGIR